jgi:DNA-binding SARP family transcriptional activator
MKRSTKAAIAKYGEEVCLQAVRYNEADGEGASTIACYLGLSGVKQADSAINAGRELAEIRGIKIR